MPGPNSTNLAPNPMLTPIATMYRNEEYVWRDVAPVVAGDLETDKFLVFGMEQFKQSDTIASANSAVSRMDWSATPDTFTVFHHGKEIPIDHVMQNGLFAASFNAVKVGTDFVTGQLDLGSEIRTQALLQTSGNYNAANVVASAGVWSNDANDPQKDIDAAMAVLLGRAQGDVIAWMNEEAWNAYKNNAKIVDRVKHVQNISTQSVTDPYAQGMGVKKLVVAKGWKLVAGVMTRIWAKTSMGLVVVPKGSPTRESLQFAATFVQKFFGNESNIYTEEGLKYGVNGGTLIRATRSEQGKVTANRAGAIITGILA